MGNLFHGPTPFILLFVVLLLFGAPKLPALAKSLGQSMKILKKEVSTPEDEKSAEAATTVAETPVATSAEDELAKAKAEAAAAKAEAEALRAAAQQRAEGKDDN
jgi:sec-independent protein translocase protein TatA